METAPQYREKSEKGLGLLSLLQGTQKVRPRRKGKGRGSHSETEDRRDKGQEAQTRGARGRPTSWSLKLRRQGPLKPEEPKLGSEGQAPGKPGLASLAPALEAQERRRGKRLHFEKCVCSCGKKKPLFSPALPDLSLWYTDPCAPTPANRLGVQESGAAPGPEMILAHVPTL